MIPRLQEKYEQEILPALAESWGGRTAVPAAVEVHRGQHGRRQGDPDKKYLESAVDALTQITGQKPMVTRARKSIASFRLREGMAIGCKVTLRRQRMYEFLDRLIALALPRVRDFRGLNPEGFDGNGNYSMGLTEQLVFPELNPDKFPVVQGMNITHGDIDRQR